MGILEILILIAIAIIIIILMRRLPDTRTTETIVQRNRGMRPVTGVGFGQRWLNKASEKMQGWRDWVGGKFGRSNKSKKKLTEDEVLKGVLKKPEDREFWIDESAKVAKPDLVAKTYFQEAEDAFKSKDYRKAEALFTEATKIDPHNAKIFNRLGVIYLERQDYDGSVKAFSTAIKYDDKISSRYYNLALAYVGQGDYQEAMNNLKQALKLSPENSKYKQVLEQVRKKC